MNTICWEGTEKLISTYKPYYRTQMMKLMHHWQYIGERKLLMKEETGQCPMQCGELESKLHYLQCKDTHITTLRNKHKMLLTKQMKALNTYPGIITVIQNILTKGYNWNWSTDLQEKNTTDRYLLQAVQIQKSLGEHSLPLGYLNHMWQRA